MNTHTVSWLILLTLMKNFSCVTNLFELEVNWITSVEGSCVEMKCKPGGFVHGLDGAHWFWMKDATWKDETKDYVATIIYSTDESKRPVDPLFKYRVRQMDSSPLWSRSTSAAEKLCNILICDLQKNDSGNYLFRFHGVQNKWATKPGTNLTVVENSCPITFKGPQTVKENEMVTLTCTTLSSCPSNPQIGTSMQRPSIQMSKSLRTNAESPKSITQIFNVSWKDDGIGFSCQTADNQDKYLIRNLSLTVEYAPKEVMALTTVSNPQEGDPLRLTCSAKGQPSVNFSWFKNAQKLISGPELKLTQVNFTHDGSYYCEAENKIGTEKSNSVEINVLHVPRVEVRVQPQQPGRDFTEGDRITLECYVNRSNPEAYTFSWLKDTREKSRSQKYVFNRIQPSDTGSYTCQAWNRLGRGTSSPYHLNVQYRPQSTYISTSSAERVKINRPLTLTCNTNANPEPLYSWYHYKPSDPLHPKPGTIQATHGKTLYFPVVRRGDEGCYSCNATNIIGSGDFSQPRCIQVLFAPTNVNLSLPVKVRAGQLVTVTCTAESFPPSQLTVRRTSGWNTGYLQPFALPHDQNIFRSRFNATSTHAGSYTCMASNNQGVEQSKTKQLEVEYSPEYVKATAQSSTVNENQTFSLDCSAQANPSVTLFTWMKMTEGKGSLVGSEQRYSVNAASPSDAGLYRCAARNEIGTGTSQQVEVKVTYAPKHTAIIKGGEQQLSDGRRSVTLTCISLCYPPATYVWYKKIDDGEVLTSADGRDVLTSQSQNITVNSDQAGEYYCTARNDLGQRSSEPIRLFDDKIRKIMTLFIICFCILFFVLLLLLVRRWRRKSIQQGTARTWPCWGLLDCWSGARRGNVMSQSGLAGPFRSRDDLLPEQSVRWRDVQRPRPDATSASNITGIYSTVDLPNRNQPTRQQHGQMQNDALNYASLDFGNKQKKPEEDAVYAKVSRQKTVKEKEQGRQEDYENVNALRAAKPPNPYNTDSETSEDEEEVNYTHVNFQPKPGHQKDISDSSTSEDETQYSEVKF
ncbi:hemicentin-2 [Cololabis saira]|uniref:hemicentin-2 n=1 Tax=Cololabis saira TaxID=129043 RepID=UPI002AD2D3E3|nr:hemicentin-2 [Cololabis saira]XP_061573323.1 hemicentin-2 [Cololabis saira]XP_061573324.1 hemicentin-2 [Cololabis saira]